jgi:hypothetical protein
LFGRHSRFSMLLDRVSNNELWSQLGFCINILAMSVPVSDIQFQRFGQGDPPKVSHRAIYRKSSRIVRLSWADLAERWHHLYAAS